MTRYRFHLGSGLGYVSTHVFNRACAVAETLGASFFAEADADGILRHWFEFTSGGSIHDMAKRSIIAARLDEEGLVLP